MLDRLEAAGLIARARSETDRRVILVRRTEADRTRQRVYEAVSEEMRAIMFAQQSGLPTRTRFLATCRLGVLPRMLSGIRRFRLP